MQIGHNWASALVATCVIFGLTTVMLVLYYGLTRIIVAMSRDGMLPGCFSAVSPNNTDAGDNNRDCGVGDGAGGRICAARSAGRAGQHRHAGGICARLRSA